VPSKKDRAGADRCPRCLAPLGEKSGKRCAVCGLTLGVPFDPTGGVPGVERYLGRVIGGHFEVLSVLAHGGHGLVLLVRHTKLTQKNIFALKLLRPEISRNPQFRKRFLREVEIVYSFSHPNIVPIREFAETEEGELFFTMDFCRGQTLEDAMKETPRFSLQRVVKIADDILKGLGFAHRHGVIHRDLKPANVFLQQGPEGETARLLDFGIAKPSGKGAAVEVTRSGKIMGTPLYMSPEQILGKPLDARTDLYSFGVVLYRLLAGRPPFSGRTGHEVLACHLRDKPPPLRKVAPRVPPELAAFVERLLAKPREHRPASAEAARRELAEAVRHIREGKLRRFAHRWRKPARIAAACLLLGGSLTGAAFLLLTPGGRARAEGIYKAVTEPQAEREAQKPDKPKPRAEAPSKPERKTEKKSAERLTKWCRFCKRPVPGDRITCPYCGQIAVPMEEAAGEPNRGGGRTPHGERSSLEAAPPWRKATSTRLKEAWESEKSTATSPTPGAK